MKANVVAKKPAKKPAAVDDVRVAGGIGPVETAVQADEDVCHYPLTGEYWDGRRCYEVEVRRENRIEMFMSAFPGQRLNEVLRGAVQVTCEGRHWKVARIVLDLVLYDGSDGLLPDEDSDEQGDGEDTSTETTSPSRKQREFVARCPPPPYFDKLDPE